MGEVVGLGNVRAPGGVGAPARDILQDARDAALAHRYAVEAQRLIELETLFRSISIAVGQAAKLMLEISAHR